MYRGYYPTYGYGASYNPWTGAYGRGAVAYGPYGGAGVGRALQPADRHLLARRRRLRAVRLARRGPGLQPAHRRLRADAPGLERLRQLGQHPGPARETSWASTNRVTNRATGTTTRTTRTDSGAAAVTRTRPGRDGRRRANGQRRRLRRPGRQRVPAAGGRRLAAARGRELGQPAHAAGQLHHGGPAQPRLRGAHGRTPAHERLQQLSLRQQRILRLVVSLERQLPKRRRVSRRRRPRRRRPAAVASPPAPSARSRGRSRACRT